MFDFDAGKLIIVGIVALIVIGPKELPRVMLQVGQAAAKMRRMAAEFRSQFMDVIREAEIDDTKSDVERLAESAKAATEMDPLAQIKAELIQAVGSAEKPRRYHLAQTRVQRELALMSYNSKRGTNFEVHLSTWRTDGALE